MKSVVLLTVFQTKDSPECPHWPLRGGHLRSEDCILCRSFIKGTWLFIFHLGTSSCFSMMIY